MIDKSLVSAETPNSKKQQFAAITIDDIASDESHSRLNISRQDGRFSMMEFAMMNFKQSIDK